MIQVIVMALVSLIFFAGGAWQAGHLAFAFSVGAPAIILLAFAFARAQMGLYSGRRSVDTLTVASLRQQISLLPEDMTVYLANPDIAPAIALFTCRMDGTPALVLERAGKETA